MGSFALFCSTLALPFDVGYDWLTPGKRPTEVRKHLKAKLIPLGTELAKTACYAMKEGVFHGFHHFATASPPLMNDQAIRDDADIEILSLEIGNAIVRMSRHSRQYF